MNAPPPHDLALADVVTQAAAIIISRHTEAQERASAEKPYGQARSATARSWGTSRTTPSSCSTPRAPSPSGPRAPEVRGYAAEEVVGRHFSMFYTPEDVASGAGAFAGAGRPRGQGCARRGRFARTAGGSGRTRWSRPCATRRGGWWGPRRSAATSPSAAPWSRRGKGAGPSSSSPGPRSQRGRISRELPATSSTAWGWSTSPWSFSRRLEEGAPKRAAEKLDLARRNTR